MKAYTCADEGRIILSRDLPPNTSAKNLRSALRAQEDAYYKKDAMYYSILASYREYKERNVLYLILLFVAGFIFGGLFAQYT